MPLDHTRFRHRPPEDEKSPEVQVTDSASASRTTVTTVEVQGRDPDESKKTVRLHARAGYGQLAADLQTHSLLEELLEEVRMLRALSEEVLRRKD